MLEIGFLEFNVIKTCNMNCKGCDHFSTLFDSPNIIPIDLFKKDLSRMKDLGIDRIRTISLLGGEPLLVSNLEEYVNVSKSIYPDAKIEIRTNGILLLKMSEALIDSLRDYNVKLIISLYPNMKTKKRKMHRFLKKKGIIHVFLVFKEQFCKVLSEESNQKDLRKYCICGSPTLEQGKLYTCPVSAFIYKLNDRFGYSFPDNSGIDIYSENIKGEEICEYLQKPIQLCEYCCREEMSVFKWECNYKSRVEVSDWIMQPDDEKMYDFRNKRSNAYISALRRDDRLNRIRSKISRIIKEGIG